MQRVPFRLAATALWIALAAAAGMAQTPAAVQSGSGATSQRTPAREHVEVPREQWQRVDDVFSALGAEPGAHIADIGAGGGYFTARLANAVGDGGRVYAVDVNPVSLRELAEAVGALSNVEIIRGEEDDPKLPPLTLDGALVVNAYHEFAAYRAMLQHILAALKPGGRLVLVEPIPRAADATRAAQAKQHTIALDLVEADVLETGFAVVTKDAGFITRPDSHGGEATPRVTDWLLVARRPSASSRD